MKNFVLPRCKRTRCSSVIGDSSIQRGRAGRRHAEYPLDTTVAQARCGLDPPVYGTRMMKNGVLPRCKRTRWNSVIGDSSIQRGSGERRPSLPRKHQSTSAIRCDTPTCTNSKTTCKITSCKSNIQTKTTQTKTANPAENPSGRCRLNGVRCISYYSRCLQLSD